MLPRDRQLATIRREPTDRISVDIRIIENAPEIAKYLNIREADVLERLGVDGRMFSAVYNGPKNVSPEGEPITEWGVPDVPGEHYSSVVKAPLGHVQSVKEVECYAWPSSENYDYKKVAEQIKLDAPRYATRGPEWTPIFDRVCSLFGMENAMMHLMLKPAIFEAAAQQVFNVYYEYIQKFLDACGKNLDILLFGDDFATQRGLMMNPNIWRKYLKPHYAKIFELGKKAGKPIWFHSCGDITSVLPDLIDIGMDVWETVQLHTLPFSAKELKDKFGKHITFFGGINTQRLPFITPQEVSEEVKEVISILGKNGGYICGPDHHIKPDVSVQNTIALFDTAVKYNIKELI